MSRESWSGAAAYEAFIGRYSRRVAPVHLDQLGVPPGRRWLDVGCGTGALSSTILERARPSALTGVDPSTAFLEAARVSISDPRATFLQGSALALPVADGSADAAVAGLVLNFVGDVPAALAEVRRALAPGGVVGAYVWDYAEGMELLRRFFDAAIAVHARDAADADEGARFPLCRPGPLGGAFTRAGFRDVVVEPIDVTGSYADFDALWSPFLGGVGAAPTYLAGLDAETQARIREHLRSTVPIRPDGSILVTARAWSVRGIS